LIYADIVDKNGTVVHEAVNTVSFQVTGNATAIGQNPLPAEAGTAGILLRAGAGPDKITISAKSENIKGANIVLNSN
jgi:beta-galactosidase